MSSSPVIWKHIGLHGHSVGTFVCDDKKIVWKSALSGRSHDEGEQGTTKTIPASALQKKGGGAAVALWTVFGKSGYLRLRLKTDQENTKNLKHELRFDGFPAGDFDLLKDTLQAKYQVELQPHNMSSAGAQYGLTSIKGKNLVFQHCVLDEMNEEGQEFEPRAEEEMLSLDLAEVSQCVLPGNNRNEIELQFPESDAVEAGTDQLVAIRFYIPPSQDADTSDKTAPTAAETMQQRIMQTATIRKTTGDVLVSFPQEQGTFLTPRGRYGIELYDYFLRMRGQKYDYKIKYDDINRLFLLPKPDEVHMVFVIALDKPIRQGQQRYQYLVLQSTKDQDEVTVNMDEETLQKDYNGELQPVMRGALSNLIAKTFKVISRKKVFIPGKFANANQQACVKCAVRANEGFLYPLEKQFVFVHKPTIIIRFNEIESVDFQRYAGGQGSTRNFDLQVNLRESMGQGARDYTFSGIERKDYAGLFNFLTSKKINVKNIQGGNPFEDAQASMPVYDEDEIYGGPDEGLMQEDSDDESFDEEAAAKEEAEAAEDDSEDDIDDDELGSEVDEDLDSDLEDARKDTKKKSKQKSSRDDVPSSPKKRKKKDPKAPKKNMTAYFFYASAMRKEIAAKNPDASFGDVTKMVAAQFKALNASERAEWDKKAKADKERYEAEMAEYSAPDTSDDEDEATPKKKAKKDPNAPKNARTAYTFFCNDTRDAIKKEQPELGFAEQNKLLGEKWKNLSSTEKQPFEDMAAKDKKRYQKEMSDYTPPAGSGKKKQLKVKKDPNAPKKAKSSYIFYTADMRSKMQAENPGIGFGELGKLMGEAYRNLSPEDMAKYEKKAEEDKERYRREMKEYEASKKGAAKDDSDDSDDDSDDDDGVDEHGDSDDDSDDDE